MQELATRMKKREAARLETIRQESRRLIGLGFGARGRSIAEPRDSALGAFWGGLWGLVFGAAILLIPGILALFATDPVAGSIVGTLVGAVVVGGMCAQSLAYGTLAEAGAKP